MRIHFTADGTPIDASYAHCCCAAPGYHLPGGTTNTSRFSVSIGNPGAHGTRAGRAEWRVGIHSSASPERARTDDGGRTCLAVSEPLQLLEACMSSSERLNLSDKA